MEKSGWSPLTASKLSGLSVCVGVIIAGTEGDSLEPLERGSGGDVCLVTLGVGAGAEDERGHLAAVSAASDYDVGVVFCAKEEVND